MWDNRGMRFFVFVNTPYYPYVDDPIEADTVEEARARVAATLRPGDETTVYLVPADAVEAVSMSGPKRAPVGLLKLMQEQNRFTAAAIEAKNLHGAYHVTVNGLANLVSSTGTLGGIEAPPSRDDFASEEAYEAALADYERRVTQFWKASVRPG